MTSHSDNSLADEDNPLMAIDLNSPESLAWLEQVKQMRQSCAEEYSSSPLWRARAERDPEYWNKFSTGRIR